MVLDFFFLLDLIFAYTREFNQLLHNIITDNIYYFIPLECWTGEASHMIKQKYF